MLVKMLNILVLCPVLLAAAVQTLTIDSQLGTSIEGKKISSIYSYSESEYQYLDRNTKIYYIEKLVAK